MNWPRIMDTPWGRMIPNKRWVLTPLNSFMTLRLSGQGVPSRLWPTEDKSGYLRVVVSRSLLQGSGFLLVKCWSGRKGGLVDPFKAPRFQWNMLFFRTLESRKPLLWMLYWMLNEFLTNTCMFLMIFYAWQQWWGISIRWWLLSLIIMGYGSSFLAIIPPFKKQCMSHGGASVWWCG